MATKTNRSKFVQPFHFSPNRLARGLVQLGFFILFVYPLLVLIYQHLSINPAPVFSSWLLPFDPLLQTGQALHGAWPTLVIGAPLLLLALSWLFGRAFCGWVCPLGSLLDAFQLLIFWRRFPGTRRPLRRRNQSLRFYVLAAVLVASLTSLQFLGWFDPLVIFQRGLTALMQNFFVAGKPAAQVYLVGISLVFIAILLLELWQPRFWCRNLCPLGALLSLISRFSLLNRRVSNQCTLCGECRQECAMRAIPRDPHNTDYTACTFCMECAESCPQRGVSFNFGKLAHQHWQPKETSSDQPARPSREGTYQPDPQPLLSRRQVLTGLAAGAVGIAITPLTRSLENPGVLRPPGALPDPQFIQTCITCQECIRVCPTGGLKPAFLESGLGGIGTPILVPRQGGCSLNPSCPNLCASVCPVGALRPTRPQELKLGIAHVEPALCLAWDQGVRCLVCVEACLNSAAQSQHGRVVVDPDKCTGCGRCENGCPVPGSAIRVKKI
jgi:polyferredoxin